jgi:hypothetical protein
MNNSSNSTFRSFLRGLISEVNTTSNSRHPPSFGGYIISEEKKCLGAREGGMVLPNRSMKPLRTTALQNECQTAS